jgi:UDP-GlcNAc:undecaprenyl-phosphate GlcNAc-1-phosphate transferase
MQSFFSYEGFKLTLEVLAFVGCGAAAATPLLFINIKVAAKLGLIDWPKARGVAEEQIPIVGASLVLLSLITISILTYLEHLSPWILTTSLVIAVIGYLDDVKPLSALDKIFFQLICAAVMIFLDPNIHQSIVNKYGAWGVAFALVFIVGLMNAVNFVDGIDGLAGLVLFVGGLGFCLISPSNHSLYPYFVLSGLLMGMLIPFLYLNVFKRKGFLGNIGSYFFSYQLAIFHLSIPSESSWPLSKIAMSGLCFLIPVADSAMIIMSRMLTFRSPFQADKGHLHHRLVQTSIALRYILLNFGLIEFAGVTAAFLITRTQGAENSLLPPFIWVSYVGISAILILMVEKASKRRIQNYFERLDSGQPIYFLKYHIKNEKGTGISQSTLFRLEARISAEIRVSDVCFTVKPNTLFVSLGVSPTPSKGVSARLEAIFASEKVQASQVIDQGEYVKISRVNPSQASLLKRVV